MKTIVGMATSKLDLNILLVLLRIRRIDLGVFGASKGLKKIMGQGFRLIERDFHIGIELFGKGIAVIDSEYSFKEVNIN